MVVGLASRLPGNSTAACSRDKVWLLVRKTAYVDCLGAIEQSLLGECVRPFPCAVTKVLRGFDVVSNKDTIAELASSCQWGQTYVESSWTYRDARDRRRAFRVSFEVDPGANTISTS